MTVSAFDVARELRAHRPTMGRAKLHKLLYYCQGWHLAMTGEPLFTMTIKAWEMGPVVAELWGAEEHGRQVAHPEHLDSVQRGTIEYVLSRYGGYSGKALIDMTHREAPWVDVARQHPGDWTRPIPHSAMREFFRADPEATRLHALADAVFNDDDAVQVVGASLTHEPQRDDPDELRRRLAAFQ